LHCGALLCIGLLFIDALRFMLCVSPKIARSVVQLGLSLVLLLDWGIGLAAEEKLKPQADPAAQLDYKKDILPLFKKYCFDCHAGKDPEGKLEIDQLSLVPDRKTRLSWVKVRDNLESTLMPPDDAEQPTEAERKRLVAWLSAKPLHLDCSTPAWPGRVTVRRLNRVEYNNTIRDLCGVDIQPAKDFPSDDIGYGFDNNGDVLSLPPLLLEKYLAAGEQVARKAILVFDKSSAPVKQKGGLPQNNSGQMELEHNFPQAGKYLLRTRVSADQAGPALPKIAFRFDDKEITQFEVKGQGRGNTSDFEVEVEAKAGRHKFAVAFLNDYYQPNDPDPKLKGDRNVYHHTLEIMGPLGVKPHPLPESHTRIIFEEPSAQLSDRDCARKLLKRFASRAYRRPATDSEMDRLTALYQLARDQGEPFERGMQVAVQAVLASPHFLFRIEQEPGKGDANGIRQLNEYELATRLSYFLWSTMPDAELLALAHQGKLREQLKPQVERMLRHEKSRALVENFAGQWLQLRSLERVSPNKRTFPSWSDELGRDMRRETELFFEHIVQEDRNVLEFITADYSFLNERLANHYGISDVKGTEFRKVKLPREQRGGLLGQASILTVTSNPGRTSPVKRGKWVLENILAAPPPPAPPNVPALDEAKQAAEHASLRVRFEMHRANPMCNACHKVLDPLGFALENYDAVGAWRTKDGRFPIDPAGVLPTGEKISGVSALREVLSTRDADFRRCLAEKLFTYALGRGPEIEDECTIRAIAAQAAQEKNRFSAFIMGIVKSEAFQKRAATRYPGGN
jgi:hypothetical protein